MLSIKGKNKKHIIISSSILILITALLLIGFNLNKIHSNWMYYKYFKDHQIPDLKKVDGEGLFITYETSQKNKHSILNRSFWISDSSFSFITLFHSLYKTEVNFKIYIFIDYEIKPFYTNNNKSANNQLEMSFNPDERKYCTFKINDLPKGAHDLLLLIVPEGVSNHYYSLQLTLFYDNHNFKNHNFINNYKESKQEGTYYYKLNRDIIVNIEKNELNECASFLILSFNKDNLSSQSQIYRSNYNNYSSLFLKTNFIQPNNQENHLLFLVTNPFIPIEYPPGVHTGFEKTCENLVFREFGH